MFLYRLHTRINQLFLWHWKLSYVILLAVVLVGLAIAAADYNRYRLYQDPAYVEMLTEVFGPRPEATVDLTPPPAVPAG